MQKGEAIPIEQGEDKSFIFIHIHHL